MNKNGMRGGGGRRAEIQDGLRGRQVLLGGRAYLRDRLQAVGTVDVLLLGR